MSERTKPARPGIIRDGPDDHGIVTVDLEFMGMTLEEYFGEEHYLVALRGRLRFHRERLLPDNPELALRTWIKLNEHGLLGDVENLDRAQCRRALQLLEATALELDCPDPFTNWQAVQ